MRQYRKAYSVDSLHRYRSANSQITLGEARISAREFGQKVVIALSRMGTPGLAEDSLGRTLFKGRNSSKEGDLTFKPLSTRSGEADWPTIVFECGYSESLHHLRMVVRWWLTESRGDVKIITIISVKLAQSMLQIEKWELPMRTPLPVTAAPFTVVRTPLVLESDKLFLRPVVPPETDITFTVQDLSNWAATFWRGVGR
jgi:hypothetical protein